MADGVEEATDVVTSIFILREYFQQGSFCIYVTFYLILHNMQLLEEKKESSPSSNVVCFPDTGS